jgi:hypothetical protein
LKKVREVIYDNLQKWTGIKTNSRAERVKIVRSYPTSTENKIHDLNKNAIFSTSQNAENFISQPVDHFNESDSRTFNQVSVFYLVKIANF